MKELLLFNVISSLVIDKATDLATEHVESMIDDLLPKDAQKELDKAIKIREGQSLKIDSRSGMAIIIFIITKQTEHSNQLKKHQYPAVHIVGLKLHQ